ncbi:MAG: cyclic nucleotide-binding domain-containing protein [Anaerolineae bacterium]|nr:cyclic nucleotide-binding domain-containing protein [Anaerolineae bacterium]
MADRFILANVKRLPLFTRLNPQQTEWVADAMQILRFEPGEVLFRQGEIVPGMMFFVSGRGSLIQRGADGIERLFGGASPNEYFHEQALFEEVRAESTLRADETSIILFLSRQQMRDLSTYHPDLRSALNIAGSSQGTTLEKPYKDLRDNENIILQTRRHWWVFVRRIAWTVALIIIIWIGSGLLGRSAPAFPWTVVALFGSVFLGAWVVYYYLEWRNDVLIITDRRVINIHRTILTFRSIVNEVPLEGIHEINVGLPPITDFIGRILGYGTIIIKTSGDNETLRLEAIGNPKAIQSEIFMHRKRYQENRAQETRNAQRSAIKGDIAKFLSSQTGGSQSPLPPASQSSGEGGLFSLKYTNENGETVYRKHHIVWTTHVVLPGMFIMAGIILLFVGVAGALIPLIMMGIGGVWFYLADWDWRNDLYIVGDKTITIIHKRPLFLADQKDQILLAQVDNVVADTKGIINSLIQVGDVRITLTGSEKSAKTFSWVYKPQSIQQEISRRQSKAEEAKQKAEAERQRQSIVEYLSVYHETVGNNAPSPFSGEAPPPPQEPPPLQVQPSRIRDRSRPPGIPRARRDTPPQP